MIIANHQCNEGFGHFLTNRDNERIFPVFWHLILSSFQRRLLFIPPDCNKLITENDQTGKIIQTP